MEGMTKVHTVQSSELSRNSAAVFAAAELGPVNISRRDGVDLVLARAGDVEDERRAVRIASDLVFASLTDTGVSLVERLRRQIPWVEFLSGPDRERFAEEIMDVTRACAEVAQYRRLLITFEAWRSTAVSVASGYTRDEDLDWLAVVVEVDDPRNG